MDLKKPERLVDDEALALVRGTPCIICRRASDACHVKSKGSGGPDVHWNLVALCRQHHSEQHSVGILSFAKKYPQFLFCLALKGWRMEHGRLWHGLLEI